MHLAWIFLLIYPEAVVTACFAIFTDAMHTAPPYSSTPIYILSNQSLLATNWVCHRINTLRPRQNGRHFADDIFKYIFLNENVWIPIKISLRFVPEGWINNIPALVQIMVWRGPGDKPLSEPMMVSLATHICVTRPQWLNKHIANAHLDRRNFDNKYWATCTYIDIDIAPIKKLRYSVM